MNNFLIKQGTYLPAIYFGMIIFAGFFAVDYSHLGQHASELAINENPAAVAIFEIGAFITGISAILYGFGLLLKFKRTFTISALLIIVFGITFLFGALFKIGSPWHGLYGVGLSIMMLPFAFLYEAGKENLTQTTKMIAGLTAFFIFLYFWAMIAGLDPMEYRGLTQRIFGCFVFGFLAYSSFVTSKLKS